MDALTRARMLGLNVERKEPKGSFYAVTDPKLKQELDKLGEIRVNFLKNRSIKGARTPEDRKFLGAVVDLRQALTFAFTDDAHMQTALVEDWIDGDQSPRITKEAIKYGAHIEILSFDFDLSDHANGRMNEQLFKQIVNELTTHQLLRGAVYYSTRGGLRALIPLEEHYHVNTENGADWKALYTQIASTLPASNHGTWDLGCGDVPRLYRLPRVVRDGEVQNGWFYVPQKVNRYYLTKQDREVILNASLTRSANHSAIKGTGLIEFFDDINLLGDEHTEINGHPSYIVTCPYAHLHSSENPTSTILMATEDGAYTVNCLHSSCSQYYKSGAWKRDLMTKHPVIWERCIGVESSEYEYSPHDPTKFVNDALAILNNVYPEKMFQRNDEIVTVERDPYGSASWSTWSADDLTGLLNRSARWVTINIDKEGNEISKPTSIPVKMVREQKRALRAELPLCDQRTVTPPLHPETMMPTRFKEGYCAITRSYFLPHPSLDLEALKRACEREPSRDRALMSYTTLTDLFIDFPWRSSAHRALAVGATMTAVLRRALDVAPMFFVSANNKGVGKTKLLSSVLASVYGETPPLSAMPDRSEELKKTLDSIVASNIDYYVFDNVNGKIGGAELDGFITSARHQYRPLGSSAVRSGRQCAFLGATGNNATINGDTDRRSIIMRLVTPLENPELRTGFRYRDLIGTAKTRVTETWIAVMEIIRAYIECSTAEERRQINTTARNLGSFEQWCDYVRDPLMWIASLVVGSDVDIVKLSALEMEDAKGDDRTELFTMLIEWQANRDQVTRKRESEWTSKALADALRNAVNNESGCYLDDFGSTLSSCSVQYVGKVLSGRRDQVGQGYRLEARRKGGKMLWRMVNVDPTEAPEPPKPTQTKTETPKRESLPVINEQCEAYTKNDVPSDLIEHKPAFEALKQRCRNLSGELCAKFKTPCEYDGVDGGINETLAKALKATLNDEIDALRSPTLPTLEPVTRDSLQVIEIVSAEVAVKTKQQAIADRLNREGFAPPSGRKWTSAKVGLLMRRNCIERPKAMKKSKVERVLERDGHWLDYWPTAHPLTQPSARLIVETIPTHENAESGTKTVSAKMLLTKLYGRVMDCKTAYLERVKRNEDDLE